MKTCTHTDSLAAPLFPCKGNLPKPKWRDVIAALAKPAIRIHKYRNLHSAIFNDAVSEYDCRKRS